MKRYIVIMFAAAALLTSCGHGGALKPDCSGMAFELLWVIDNDVYNSPAGDSLRLFIEGDVPFLPQPEPQFRISRIERSVYDDKYKTTRNMLFVDIDPGRYTKVSIKMEHDLWANNQAVCFINSPSKEMLEQSIGKKGGKVVEFFLAAERDRMRHYFEKTFNNDANDTVYELFDCNITIPASMNRYKTGDHFLWISNTNVDESQNLLIYSVRYSSTDQLTNEAIVARRDSVLKENIPGQFEGSYMGTEVKYMYPSTETITHNGEWGAVTRGLWRMQNGAAMGGPFVSLTRIDKVNKRIVTIEGFVYAPSRTKRNLLRQMDAMVYSLLTPQDINKQREKNKKDTIQ